MIRFAAVFFVAAFAGLALAQDSEPVEAQVEPEAEATIAQDAPESGIDSVISDAAKQATASLRWAVPEPVDFVCPFKGELDYEPGDIQCGFISVPENREKADSRMIRLHYVKIAATGEEEDYREDPVIYLTGGPGVGVNTYVKRLREHDLLKQRDLYILEQRGIGASGNFCPYYGMTQRALVYSEDVEQAQRNAAEVTRNCFQAAHAAGVDLSGYNTVENARDVKALRQALGFDQWNVWGISYGSHLGQMLALQDPEGIKALVLDAIVPNDLTDLMRIGRWGNRVLENVFSSCTDLKACEGMEARLNASLDATRGNPVTVELDDTELYPDGKMQVSGLILGFAPFAMAYEQDEHPAIPAVMDALIGYFESGDDAFFRMAAEMGGGSGGLSMSQGMSSAIRCNDGYVQKTAEVIEDDMAENPRFKGLMSTPAGAAYAARMCEEEGLAPRDRSDYRFVETDIPTLVVNGGWDPVTPPPLAEYIAPGFSNGRYIEVPYAGHGPTRSMSECAGPVLNAFFDKPDPAALDASCLEEGVAKPEYLAFKPTRAPVILGAKAVEDPKNLVVPGIWAGASVVILALGFLAIPASFVSRRIDGEDAGSIDAGLGGTRWAAWLTSMAGAGFAALLGYGFYAASEVSPFAAIGGIHPSASMAPWLSLTTGLLALLTLLSLIGRRRSDGAVRFSSLLGLGLLGISGLALSVFALVYDLSVF
jgi:pimeloyl-ACP methyl ester carboxylesterase